MTEHQILLKVRNLKHFNNQNLHEFLEIRTAVENKLQEYGYTLEEICCGRYKASKQK